MVFVPARFAAAAIDEAIDAGVGTVIAITEGIPVLDMLRTYWKATEAGVRLIGPNCPGVLSPGKANVGIIPAQFFDPGSIGVVSKSGTLTYQIGNELKQAGLGNSSIVGIGGDPIVGSDFIDILDAVRERRRDRADRDGRRDRRRRRGARRRVHRPVGHEARRRLHRRLHGAPRASRWATPGRSSPAPRAPPRRRRRRSRRRACGSAASPTETAQLAAETLAARAWPPARFGSLGRAWPPT